MYEIGSKKEPYQFQQNIKHPKELTKINENFASVTPPLYRDRLILRGRLIPLILRGELKTEIAGIVTATVSVDVRAETGNKILIPKGSKVIGKYTPLQEVGQKRVNVVFEEIQTTDGVVIKFSSDTTIAYDIEGIAGLTGEIDNRLMDKYGEAAIIAAATAGTQMTFSTRSDKTIVLTESLAKQSGQVSLEALKKKLDVKDTIRIPKGTPCYMKPDENILFPDPFGETVTNESLLN